MGRSSRSLLVLLFVLPMSLLTFLVPLSLAADHLSPGGSISGNETLISAGNVFALGFFSPGGSGIRTRSSYYLGIWYNNIPQQTIVWVANRQTPLHYSLANLSLTLTDSGKLVITSNNKTPLWSTEIIGKNLSGPVTTRITDEGNLVVVDGTGVYAWQSFEHPTDTMLLGMKLGVNRRTGLNATLASWRSSTDPSPGVYTFAFDVRGAPQLFLYTGSVPKWRSGPWTGRYFSGIPEMQQDKSSIFEFTYIDTTDEVSFMITATNKSMLSRASRLTVNERSGMAEVWIWMGGDWNKIFGLPQDLCDNVGACGGYSLCEANISTMPCKCMRGFVPRNPQAWGGGESKAGCRRATPPDCRDNGTTDGFMRIGGVKTPDTADAAVETGWGEAECRDACLRNCSCTAYAAARADGGGCLMWFQELLDVRSPVDGAQDLFVRVAAADLEKEQPNKVQKKVIYAITTGGIALAMTILASIGCFIKRKRKNNNRMMTYKSRDTEVPIFHFTTISAATNNFAIENILGKGGFGPVYKGSLETGQEVAIKRLSGSSTQGIMEFKNEVAVIAKLQHRNLVRLLGFCMHGNERILIYEFMRNRSLDHILFDKNKRATLDWATRYEIILGVARGLLYLHQDSRLRIIHRDLKAGNILLDEDMNPKISDFGIARIFGGNETEANTNRVVGTYGYMSPEYALHGIFSIKSDVFSFGVLLLEIISGLKNRAIFQVDPDMNLLGQAWRLWKANKSFALVDPSLESFPTLEALNCIKIGLLCVQEQPGDRPTMPSIITMLTTRTTVSLPEPKEPGYVTMKECQKKEDRSSNTKKSSSMNEMSTTIFEGR